MVSCQPQRAALPTALPMYAMAKALWNRNSRFEDIEDEYFTASFGDKAGIVKEYLNYLSVKLDIAGARDDDNEGIIEGYLAAKDVIRDFAEKQIIPNRSTNTSWNYLSYHAEMCLIYADVLISYAKRDDDKKAEHIEKLRDYIISHTDVLHNVFDIRATNFAFRRYLKYTVQ